MLRIALFVVSLAMLTGGALAAQSAIQITRSLHAEPADALPKRDKVVLVVRWDGYGQTHKSAPAYSAIVR